MQSVRKALIAAASVGALMTVMGASPAAAGPVVNFTWNPAATTGGTLSTASGATPIAPQFTADNMTIADYATINVASLSSVTESAILAVTAFNAGVNPAGFVGGSGGGAGSANAGATPYELYFVVNATSHLSPITSTLLLGAFDSLTYTMFGDVGGNCTFAVGGASCGGDKQLVLATGSLDGGLNQALISSGIPQANADATIVAGTNAGSFFVSPSNLATADFESAFTNTGGVVSQSGPIFTINGGGGNVDMVVPEPGTVAMFGMGLLGLAWFMRRRSKAA